MGGNAIKQVPVRRYERVEFEALSVEVIDIVKQNFNSWFSKQEIIPYYRNKPSFGDMDVVAKLNAPLDQKSIDEIREHISKAFDSKEIHFSDKVFSFEYKNFQIDLICCVEGEYETSRNYFSYNDLGNLVGRVAKSSFNLSFGHKGLLYKVRYDNSLVLGEILLSTDIREMLSFLGFDPQSWKEGFDEIEDVFRYVISSKYFHKSYFDLNNLNHINKTRNRKRESYMSFLKFIEGLNLPDSEPQNNESMVFKAFPNLEEAKNNMIEAYISSKLVKDAARASCLLHIGGENHKLIAYAMKKFRESDISNAEEAAQFIYLLTKSTEFAKLSLETKTATE